jgi:hypothetical protein
METDNVVLELLRAMRRDMARMADNIKGLRSEMIAVRMHGLGVERQQFQDHADIAQLKDRVERIETRLGLVV